MEEKMIKSWKVMSSRYLAEKPWFTVREERVQLPNGNEIPNYYVFEYPDWVNVIAVTRDGKYVFERQYRHAVGLVSYELCAGVCEPDDASPLESARRELLEETGYGNGEWEELMILSPNPGTHTFSQVSRYIFQLRDMCRKSGSSAPVFSTYADCHPP